MAEKKGKGLTIFQKLDTAINNSWVSSKIKKAYNNYNVANTDKKVLFRTSNKEEYTQKLLQLRQEKMLANMWHSTNEALSTEDVNGATRLSLLYRDVELMDGMPEIGSALDMVAEEATLPNEKGNIVNVYSNSERVKTILEDLFVNRLKVSVTSSMIVRGMAKYGNMFSLLNIATDQGVLGWRLLPVTEMVRIENGMEDTSGMQIVPKTRSMLNGSNSNIDDTESVKFVWQNGNQQVPYHSWQIAHFRLLTDSSFLPYGTSYLNKARRHWRMLSLMEDMMLLYRLERSIERRVFKIYVGNIDDKDVPAFVDEIANQFKRTPIVDPMTGQLDLRKNLMPVHEDSPIPLLDGRTLKIKELAKEYEEGKVNYVYSIQDTTHKIVCGKVVWCGKNYTARKLYKVILDDDTYMVMAGEHEIVMRNGIKVRADQVSVGDSVMPFYRQLGEGTSKMGYKSDEKVYNPNSGKYEHTHKLVAELTAIENGNPSCNHKTSIQTLFDNIVWERLRLAIVNQQIRTRNELVGFLNTNCIEHLISINHSNKLNSKKKISIKLVENSLRKIGFNSIGSYIDAMKKNHKIKSIEIVEGADVYCMRVEGLNGEDDRHNFALQTINQDCTWNTDGCFVSNSVSDDYFIPTRDPNGSNPIETLAGAQNMTAMDDIKYVENKMFTALRCPRAFLNYDDSNAGDSSSLAMKDIRFVRGLNRIQQAFLEELNKVAMIHLFLLGFEDDLCNFTLTMNNPSTQAEQLEIETKQKKIQAVRDAVTDPGVGFGIYSMQKAQREILHWSDKEIKENLQQLRLEKAIAKELEKTDQIIKRTQIFDEVDRIYGELNAKYQDEDGATDDVGGEPQGGGMPMDGGMPMGDMGNEGEIPMEDAADADAMVGGGEEMPMESVSNDKPMLNEIVKKYGVESIPNNTPTVSKSNSIYNKAFFINEEFNEMSKGLKDFFKNANEKIKEDE